MIVAINYADKKYRKAQKFNSYTAIDKGKVDKVFSYSEKDIDTDFKHKNYAILSQKRGNGYWLWKPYIILRSLEQVKEGDFIVYLDSGAFYINDVRILIREMENDNQSIMSFEIPFKESWYTKRDTFIALGCDTEEFTSTNQRMATMIIFKKNEFTVDFVKEWITFGEQEHIITDKKNVLGKNNYRGFREHRHDQSIFSLLAKKYKLKSYRDPSQFGRFPSLFWNIEINDYNVMSHYPQIIAEHRKGKVSKEVYREQLLFSVAPQFIIKFFFRYIKRNEKKEKIAILTDNRPISEEHYGYGMYKVVYRLMVALDDYTDTVICTDPNVDLSQVDVKFRNKIHIKNGFHRYNGSGLENIFFVLDIFYEVFKLRKRGVNRIFIPLGADYHELQRAYIIKKIFGLDISVYVVDDFVDYQRNILNNDNKIIEKKIVTYLSAMNNIFVISDGMRKRIYKLAKKNSTILPLPYEYVEIEKTTCNEKYIMFVGNISGLYLEGLQDIAEIIDQINTEKNANIKLLFTYKNVSEVKRILGNYKCIISNRVDGEGLLRMEMNNSLFCFMPYSNSKEYYLMQNTSFPSKLVEYLASAKSIVVYGNNNNSAISYFKKNNIPYVIRGRNKDALKEIVLYHLKKDIDYSIEYSSLIKSMHSNKQICHLIINKMMGE